MKHLVIAVSIVFAGASGGAFAQSCERQAEDKKLHGAAKTSFVKKCEAENPKAASCEKEADDKKLHGAARKSFVTKCSG